MRANADDGSLNGQQVGFVIGWLPDEEFAFIASDIGGIGWFFKISKAIGNKDSHAVSAIAMKGFGYSLWISTPAASKSSWLAS